MGELLKQHLTQVSHDANLNYWEGRWQKDQIGFHRFGVNEYVCLSDNLNEFILVL